jgi:diguanylate cyclase (GGDEF)-like protein
LGTMPLTHTLLDYLDRRSRAAVWSMLVGSLVCLGIIDYLTGAQLTISFFYLFPVSVAGWRLGRNSAGLVALACALTWESTNLLAGEIVSSPGVVVWNTLTPLAIFLVVGALVAQLRVLLDQQTALARKDPLTGVLNRRAFFEAANVEVAKLKRHKRPLTVLFVDVDGFKALNDTRGHHSGDMVLKCIAEHMEHEFRGTDIVGRMGGDEYAVLLPEMNAEAAHQAIPRLQASLASEMARSSWPVTFSMGVLTCNAAPRDAENAFDFADRLMYAAKGRGGNCVQYACFPDDQKTVPVKREGQP